MKLFSRKFNLSLIFGLLFLGTQVLTMKLKQNLPNQHIVVDHSTDPSLHHVIRRSPTVTTEMREIPQTRPSDSPNFTFSNTSDNNGASINQEYGKSPEIAGPAIYVHSKGTLSVVSETPAHVGWRNEKKTITSFNKATSILIY
jgi:hypothetical protein